MTIEEIDSRLMKISKMSNQTGRDRLDAAHVNREVNELLDQRLAIMNKSEG